MKDQRKAAPERSGKKYNDWIQDQYKDIKNSLPYHQKRVFNLLSDGIPRSAADISIALHLSDPRGIIRYIRKAGIIVSDYWAEGEYGRKFKRYFIRKEAGNE